MEWQNIVMEGKRAFVLDIFFATIDLFLISIYMSNFLCMFLIKLTGHRIMGDNIISLQLNNIWSICGVF